MHLFLSEGIFLACKRKVCAHDLTAGVFLYHMGRDIRLAVVLCVQCVSENKMS